MNLLMCRVCIACSVYNSVDCNGHCCPSYIIKLATLIGALFVCPFVFNFHGNHINFSSTMSSIKGLRMRVLVACTVELWATVGKKIYPNIS